MTSIKMRDQDDMGFRNRTSNRKEIKDGEWRSWDDSCAQK